MRYATVEEVEAGFRDLTDTEKQQCEAMLEEAAIIIDVYNQKVVEDTKSLQTLRHRLRAQVWDTKKPGNTRKIGLASASHKERGDGLHRLLFFCCKGPMNIYVIRIEYDLINQRSKNLPLLLERSGRKNR